MRGSSKGKDTQHEGLCRATQPCLHALQAPRSTAVSGPLWVPGHQHSSYTGIWRFVKLELCGPINSGSLNRNRSQAHLPRIFVSC